jgi:Mrp family chromosome partitioning ATPase
MHHATPPVEAEQQPPTGTAVWDAGSIVVDMSFGGIPTPEPAEPAVAPPPQKAPVVPPQEEIAPPIESVPDEATEPAPQVETSPTVEAATPVADVQADDSPDFEQVSSDDESGFAPAWEVDRFCWPEDVDQLFETQADYFDYAGKKLLAASREGLKTLAITAACSGEGATTMAMSLSRAAANAGAKVVLLDGNFRNPELGDRLGVDFSCGWQVVAAGETPLSEAAIAGLEENITLLPSATGEAAAGIQSLGDGRVAPLLRQALGECDLLIIDAGQEDLGDIARAIDGAIVVRDVRTTFEQQTLNIATLLKEQGVKAVGVAENFTPSQQRQIAAAA